MKNIILICFVFLIGEYKAQVSVYNCSVINPVVTQSEVNSAYEFHKQCVLFEGPQNYQFGQTDENKVTANENIILKENFHAGPYTDSGHMLLKIENQSLVGVNVMGYTDLNEVKKFEKFELDIELPNNISIKVANYLENITFQDRINPYLDWEIRVFAEFTHPQLANPIFVDGFYYQNFNITSSYAPGPLPLPANGVAYLDAEYSNLESYIPEDALSTNFKIRLSPPLTGLWTCKIHISTNNQTTTVTSAPFSFNVIPSSNKGYLQVGANKRFLKLGNDPFYPIGGNAPWPQTHVKHDPELANYVRAWDSNINDWGKSVPESYKSYYVIPRVYDKYRSILANLSNNGANMIRTIMAPHSTEMEWEKLGDYTTRLPMGQEMDKIVELAEINDFYLLWNMQIHYSFQPSDSAYYVSWAWDSQPNGETFCYNSLIGTGEPLDFFTHAESKRYYKQRLRYILARWGYSTHIGIFELFSEINQVTLNGTKTGSYYENGNWQVFADWQEEMGSYIKTHHNGATHLLTCSYAGPKNNADNVYVGEPFDISSKNEYDFNEPSFGAFFTDGVVAKNYLDESDNTTYNIDSYTYTTGYGHIDRSVKPLIFSETGVIELTQVCDYNKIEMDRLLWHSLFSGVAFALDWDLWFREPNSISVLGQAKQFISGHQLDDENWHPGWAKPKDPQYPSGATYTDYDPNLKDWSYRSNYAKRMEGITRQADLSYLRSGDRNYAIGVITNKTYNIYSVEDCFDETWKLNNELFKAGWLTNLDEIKTAYPINCKGQKLKLKNMRPNKYYINYFTPNNLSAPIHSSDDWGPNVKIDYKFTGGESDYITVIMARKKNTSWLPTQADSTALAKILKESFNDTANFDISIFKPQNDIITIFPIPSSDKVTIKSNEYTNLNVLVVSTEGKHQDSFIMKRKKHTLDISGYQNGVYFLKFYLSDSLIETKKIVKL